MINTMDTDELSASVTAARPPAYVPASAGGGSAARPPETTLHPLLTRLLDDLEPPAVREVISGTFGGLTRLLYCLGVIKDCLNRGGSPENTVIVFNLIHEKSHSLLAFLEARAGGVGDAGEEIADALDGVCFAIRHELRRVFDGAPLKLGVGPDRAGSLTLAEVVRAHGLLSNCFEQSMISVAQLFDARVTAVEVFSDYKTKLEQSVALRKELHRLYGLVRRSEERRELRAYFDLFKALRAFRADQMHNLMYRDWADCEAFVEGITASRNSGELQPLLHQFALYLETLIRHVGMRAVLAGHPPEHYGTDEASPPASRI